MPTGKFIWHPPTELVKNSNLTEFMEREGISDYNELVRRSTQETEWFWRTISEELSVEWFTPYTQVMDLSGGFEMTKWFVGGKLNITHNAVDRHAASGRKDRQAFVWMAEDGGIRTYTYGDLHLEVSKFASVLKGLGIGKGDVVAAFLPMLPETVITLFATLKVGAVFLPIFSGFGAGAVAARLRDSGAEVVVTADGGYRRGKVVKLKEVLDEALRDAPGVRSVVVKRRLGIDTSWNQDRDSWWDDLRAGADEACPTEPVDSEHPALLLYTSGTTGRPKGAVISHIGALLQPSKEIRFNMDFKDRDLFLWITDIGWMMGPWQIIGCQHLGGTHAIFEGAPDHPPDRIWSMIERLGITHLGGSATVFRLMKSYGDELLYRHDLGSLRFLGNTGEPLDADTWYWLLRSVGKERCPIINISGGTEIFGCLVSPSPVMPLRPSTVGGPALGMDVDVFDEDGRPVRGQIGYLVCKKPAPSMTRGFWGDLERYLQTYWSRWPKVWYHGDWASVDEDGFWYLHGRADDVIKIAGKRLGPAEVEFILDQNPSVRESAAIGVPHDVKGEVLVCFVSLRPGRQPTEELKRELLEGIVGGLGKAFTPEQILFLRDLPKNRAGKIMRRMLRSVLLGQPLGDTSILENPDILEEIREAIRP